MVLRPLLDQHDLKTVSVPGGKTLGDLVDLWLSWTGKRYLNMRATGDLYGSLKTLLYLHASEPADQVGPLRIAEAQELMAKQGRTRQGINKATRHIRQCLA